MRRKSDFISAFTEMFNEDQNKRIVGIKSIKQIATFLGQERAAAELIPFFHQFLDDEPEVIIAVMDEIEYFIDYLESTDDKKKIIPLLIEFCNLDERQIALKSIQLMKKILHHSPLDYVSTIKGIFSQNMSVSKQSGAILITQAIQKIPEEEINLLQIYKTLITSTTPVYRIIGAKYIQKLSQKVQNKDQILKMIDLFYNDHEDLPRLMSIDTLLSFYSINSEFVLAKISFLTSQNSLRVNLKVCEYASEFCQKINTQHYKMVLQPFFIKMLSAEDNETRAVACKALPGIAKNMNSTQIQNVLLPIINRISQDCVNFVKNEFAKNIIETFQYFPTESVNSIMIPLIMKLMNENNLEACSEILNSFKQISKHLPYEKYQQVILRPLSKQLCVENWRVKISTLQILSKIIIENNIYTDFIVEVLVNEIKDPVDATRRKVVEIIAEIAKSARSDWYDGVLVQSLFKLKFETSYLLRQKLLNVIDMTLDTVSPATLAEYKTLLREFLRDKIPNIRMISLKILLSHQNLLDKNILSTIQELKNNDEDVEVKKTANLM